MKKLYNDTPFMNKKKSVSNEDLAAQMAQNTNLTINVKSPPKPIVGAKGDGVVDDTAAIQNIITYVEANYKGATLFFPNGDYKIDGTIITKGCNKINDFMGVGGISFIGESMRGTRLIKSNGGTLMQWGTDASKQSFVLKNMTFLGTRGNATQSIGLDSVTVGGGYVFEALLFDNFDIGIRYHDCTFVSGNTLNMLNCGIGLAMGFFSDVQHYVACKFNKNDIAVQVGYANPDRGESSPTVLHASGFFTCAFALNGLDMYILGNNTQNLSINNCYFEQWSDMAIRIGSYDLTKSITGTIKIDNSYFNGNRVVAPIGKKAHAIEVNYATSVVIDGCNFENHSDSPIEVRHFNSGVKVLGGKFSRQSGESGDIKLVDGSYVNVTNNNINRDLFVGKAINIPASQMTALPTANADWLGATINVKGEDYKCELVDGAYSFVRVPKVQELSTSLFFGVDDFTDAIGTMEKVLFNSYIKAWKFPDGSDEPTQALSIVIPAPKGWATYKIALIWANLTNGATGNCNFQIRYSNIVHNTAMTFNTTNAGLPCGALNVPQHTTYFSNLAIVPNTAAIAIKLWRGKDDGFNGDAALIGATLTRVS